jgi:hypothetical protein
LLLTKILAQFGKTVTDGLRGFAAGIRRNWAYFRDNSCTQQATNGFSPPVRRDDATRT